MKSPFKFLDSYTKDDREIFFGRDREIEELYHRVFESKIMLVYGVSGTGKSSLIHCGLANKFQDTDWLPIVIRRGGNIIKSMAAGIGSASLTKQQSKFTNPADFKKAVRSLYLDHYKPVFFIFDQFEELFIFGDKEERRSFIHIVKLLTESELQCRMIFVMREEYMAGVTEFEKFIPTFFSNRVRIEKMSHRNAIEAIKQPCKVFNISLEDGFAESLLEKLSPGESDVELTYLQVFLDKIFRLALGFLSPPGGESKGGSYPSPEFKGGSSLSFTLSLLSKTGNVSDLLGDFLEEQISQLANPDEGLAVLKSFVSVKGSRRQMYEEEVSEYARTLGQPLKVNDLRTLLHSFVNLRILCDKDHKGKYELRHDALANKIYEKISLVEKEIMEIRQFVENAWNSHQKRGILISAADLGYIAPYESRLFLPEELEELIRKSKNELVRANKRKRNIFTAAGIFLILVLSAFTFWAIKERNNAVRKEIQARANNFNYLAKEMVNENPTIAFRLVEYAFSLDSSNKDIRNNYYQTYYSNNFYKKVELLPLKNVYKMAFLPDGRNIITSLLDGSVKINDRNGNLVKIFKGNAKYVNCFRTSPDGQFTVTVSYFAETSKLWNTDGELIKVMDWEGNDEIIGVAPDGKSVLQNGGNGIVNILDINGKPLKTYKIHEDNVFIGTYTPDGNYIVTGSDDKTAKLWDLDGNIIQTFIGHQECINSIDFSDDGNLILTGSDDKTARVWDLKGNVLSVLKAGEEIYSAVFYPGINSIWTISNLNTVCKWNVILNPKVNFDDQVRINSVEFSPHNNLVLAGYTDHTVKLWDIKGKLIRNYNNRNQSIASATFSLDGEYILENYHSDTSACIAKVWDLSGKEIQSINSENPGDQSLYVDFSNDGKYYLISFIKPTVSIFDCEGNIVNTVKNIGGIVYSVTFSPDSKSFLTGSFDKTAKLWDLNGSLMGVFNHDHYVLSVAFSPDGKYILTGSVDKTAKLWALNGELIRVYNCDDEVYSVAFSPDGNNILTGHFSGLVRLWDLEGSLLQILDAKSVQIWALAFSPNGKYFASGSQTGLKIFDIKLPLDDFLKQESIEELSVNQQLKYKLITVDDILNSSDEKTISEAADYLLQEAKLSTEPEKRNEAIWSSCSLYDRALLIRETNKLLLGLYNAYSYRIEQKSTLRNDTVKLNRVFSKLFSSNADSDLIETADFFFRKVDNYDSDTLKIKYYSIAITFYEKALSISGSEDVKTELFDCYNLVSQAYLNDGDYLNALNSARRGIEIKDTINLHVTLSLAYVLSNQYSEAETEIEESRKNPGNYVNLSKGILSKISTLENAGFSHPDFEKVKKLLKK